MFVIAVLRGDLRFLNSNRYRISGCANAHAISVVVFVVFEVVAHCEDVGDNGDNRYSFVHWPFDKLYSTPDEARRMRCGLLFEPFFLEVVVPRIP